ncbi:hypothetical protein BMS83_02145 [Leuconostoc pseudomesenteroides]|nr:hypothetical protein BMS83_02145 [Leuconostoc pseudomesenteroides]
MKNNKGGFFRNSIFYVFIFLVVVGMFYGLFGNDKSTTKTLTSSEFIKALNDKEIKSITVQPGNSIYNITVTGLHCNRFDFFVIQRLNKFT